MKNGSGKSRDYFSKSLFGASGHKFREKNGDP